MPEVVTKCSAGDAHRSFLQHGENTIRSDTPDVFERRCTTRVKHAGMEKGAGKLEIEADWHSIVNRSKS